MWLSAMSVFLDAGFSWSLISSGSYWKNTVTMFLGPFDVMWGESWRWHVIKKCTSSVALLCRSDIHGSDKHLVYVVYVGTGFVLLIDSLKKHCDVFCSKCTPTSSQITCLRESPNVKNKKVGEISRISPDVFLTSVRSLFPTRWDKIPRVYVLLQQRGAA